MHIWHNQNWYPLYSKAKPINSRRIILQYYLHLHHHWHCCGFFNQPHNTFLVCTYSIFFHPCRNRLLIWTHTHTSQTCTRSSSLVLCHRNLAWIPFLPGKPKHTSQYKYSANGWTVTAWPMWNIFGRAGVCFQTNNRTKRFARKIQFHRPAFQHHHHRDSTSQLMKHSFPSPKPPTRSPVASIMQRRTCGMAMAAALQVKWFEHTEKHTHTNTHTQSVVIVVR